MLEAFKSNGIDPFDVAFKLVGITDLNKIERIFLIKILVSLDQVKQRFADGDTDTRLKALSIAFMFGDIARDFVASVVENETDEEVREGARDALADIDDPIVGAE